MKWDQKCNQSLYCLTISHYNVSSNTLLDLILVKLLALCNFSHGHLEANLGIP